METAKNIFYPWRWYGLIAGKKEKSSNPTAEQRLEMKLMPYQQYLFKFQELVLWKKPYETILFLALLQCFFIFLVYTKLRFYCVVCWTTLALVLHEAWIYRIWPTIKVEQPTTEDNQDTKSVQPTPEGMLSVPELSKCATCVHSFITSAFIYLKSLRSSHPATFCGVLSSVLIIMIQVGSAVSGLWLLYMLVMLIVLTPGVVFRLMSPQTREMLANIFSRIASFLHPKESEIGFEEYLPEQNKENLTLFNLACSDNVEKTNVSTPSSEMDVLPAEPIPSHDESSVDRDYSLGLDVNALDAVGRVDDLSFKPTHFNGSTLGTALKKALAETLGQSLVSAAASALVEAEQHSDSDSSEFELIEPEDDDNPHPT